MNHNEIFQTRFSAWDAGTWFGLVTFLFLGATSGALVELFYTEGNSWMTGSLIGALLATLIRK